MSACRRSGRRCRISSRDRRSGCRTLRCARARDWRRDADNIDRSRRPRRESRGRRAIPRPSPRSSLAGRRLPAIPPSAEPASRTGAAIRPSACRRRFRSGICCPLRGAWSASGVLSRLEQAWRRPGGASTRALAEDDATPSLRGALATKQSSFLREEEAGLLRFARNDVQIQFRVLAAPFARALLSYFLTPSYRRAEGRPGARCTRGLVCKNCAKETHTSIQVQRRPSGLPCAMVLRLIPCSP